jgi:hypothetical protein
MQELYIAYWNNGLPEYKEFIWLCTEKAYIVQANRPDSVVIKLDEHTSKFICDLLEYDLEGKIETKICYRID